MGLLDFLQSASNAVAGNVAGPVDLIALGLNKAGLPIREPMLGSEWMKKRGLTTDVPMGAARIAGETVGLLSPTVIAQKAPQIARGLLQGAENLAAPRTLNPQTGAIVWHGSPHKFDRFDSSKIGTGEGAQAYGHGLYLAESPAVAEGYKRSNMFGVQNAFKNTGGELPQIDEVTFLGRKIGGIAGDGAALRPVGAADPGMSDGLRRFPSGGTGSSIAGLGYGATPAKLKAIAPDLTDNERAALQALINSNGRADTAAEILRAKGRIEAAKIAQDAASNFAVTRMTEGTGSLYKVDLPDTAIARMLDWDKPLSQQAPEVQKAVENIKASLTGPFSRDMTGEQLLSHIQSTLRFVGRGPEKAESLIRQQGIPGIRYLDGDSRGVGLGTSNYVVFPSEEGLLTILERNGQRLTK